MLFSNFSCNSLDKQENKKSLSSNVLDTENLDWLIGNWTEVSQTNDNHITLKWTKVDDENYAGNFSINVDGEVHLSDSLNIFKDNNVWYITIEGFDKPIIYDFKSVGENKFIANETFPFYIDFWYEGNKLKAKIQNEEIQEPIILERIIK